MEQNYRNLKVALLGAGSVGSQVARLLLEHGEELAGRIGTGLDLIGVAVRDTKRSRDTDIPAELLTDDAESLILKADIVVELIGGIEPARELVLQALNAGADVVTANKALLATHGKEIFDLADSFGAQVFYEAAVAGAIPIIRPLRESLAGDRINRIIGIVNGTTNFILDRMDTDGESLEDALAIATDLGYAEADPSADIEGTDAAAKAAILASLAFHSFVPLSEVHHEGVTKITREQILAAKASGHVVKLLAIAERIPGDDDNGGKISVRVYPALISREHPLASVRGANNAVFINAEAAGDLMFYGAGAGGVQTASAVLGDIVSAAKSHLAGGIGVSELHNAQVTLLPFAETVTRYQVILTVHDRPGVLAEVAQVFSAQQVSVETVQQTLAEETGIARLTIGTHSASEAALAQTVAELDASGAVHQVESILRIEEL